MIGVDTNANVPAAFLANGKNFSLHRRGKRGILGEFPVCVE